MKRTAIYPALVVIALAFLLSASTVGAQEATGPTQEKAPLTLEEAIDLARRNNPAFLQTLNDLGPASWNLRSANADRFLPTANFNFFGAWQDEGQQRFGAFTTRQPAVLLSQWQLSLNYTLDGSTFFRPGQRSAEKRAVERRIDNAELDLRNQVASAYIEVLRLQARAEQAAREVRRSEEHLRLAEARQEVGAGTRLETMQAEVTLGRAQVDLLQARNSARVAKLRLIQALGVQVPADRIELVSTFELTEPEYSLDDLLTQAMNNHPSLVALRADRAAANASARVAKSAYFPRLSLQASWSGFAREETDPSLTISERVTEAQQQSAAQTESCITTRELFNEVGLEPPVSDCSIFEFTSTDSAQIANQIREANDVFPFQFQNEPVTLSAVVSIPIFTGFQRQVQVEQAVAQRNDVDHQLRATELQIRADVEEALHNLETGYETVLLQRENTERAREELRLARERYQLGAGTFLELLDSETLATQAEVDQIEAMFGFHQSLAALEAAVGQPLELTGNNPGDDR